MSTGLRELEAGPDLNLMVAKAVGIEARIYPGFVEGPQCGIVKGHGYHTKHDRWFSPSTDWNDAMEAAKLFFGEGDAERLIPFMDCLLEHLVQSHNFIRKQSDMPVWLVLPLLTQAGPLAICKAILGTGGE